MLPATGSLMAADLVERLPILRLTKARPRRRAGSLWPDRRVSSCSPAGTPLIQVVLLPEERDT